MIDRNIKIENLDAATWNNIGAIYDALWGTSATLYVLRSGSEVINIADSLNREYERSAFKLSDPTESVSSLFAAHADIDRIILIEELSLIDFYRQAQNSSRYDLDSDELNAWVNELFESHEGVDIFNREGKRENVYTKIDRHIKKTLSPNCTLFLRVSKAGAALFHCIVGLSGWKVVSLTTLDCFGEDVSTLLENDDVEIARMIEARFHGDVRTISFDIKDLEAFARN